MFIIEDNRVKPSPEMLLIPIFKQIWEDDTTEKKDIALLNFAYIEFVLSPKKSNPFSGYSKDIRAFKVIQSLNIDTAQLHESIDEAMEIYKDFIENCSPSMAYYNSAVEAAEKLKMFFSTFNLNEKIAKTGAPMYKPADITRALQDTQKVVMTLEDLREKVEKEILENTKNRGNRTVKTFEKRPNQ